LGIKNSAKDVLINLNEHHLSKDVKTIFEELEENGKKSASVNFIVHRGTKEHHIKMPFLLNLFTWFSFNNVKISGPEILSLGAMHKPVISRRKIFWSFNQSIFKQFGINDDYSLLVAKHIIASGKQPDLTFIYLPDHDHYLHKYINQPMKSLAKVDKKLSELLSTFESWQRAIEHNIFIIIGDHGQTKIGKEQKYYNIDLDGLLNKFKITQVGKRTKEGDDLIIANNERMVYIYPLDDNKREPIRKVLLTESRIDFLAWKEGQRVVVENHQGMKLTFSKQGEFTDTYQQTWDIKGNYDLLDIKVKQDNTIEYSDYPDALARLYGALFSQETFSYVLSAKPAYEFYSASFPTHLGGGSHGSLHRTDSLVPLLISGATKYPEEELRLI